MKTIIVLTGSRALLGRCEFPDVRPLVIYPIENPLSQDEEDILELNTGVAFMAIHYPHTIRDEIVGGIIDVTDPPVNPLLSDDKQNII